MNTKQKIIGRDLRMENVDATVTVAVLERSSRLAGAVDAAARPGNRATTPAKLAKARA